MKNLILSNVIHNSLDINCVTNACICYEHSDGNTSGEIYVFSNNLDVTNYNDIGSIKWSTELNKWLSLENSPLDITYLTLTNSLCIGTSKGEIVTIVNNGTERNLAGQCECGLKCMRWSPDQELLVLVTNDGRMILMSYTFDTVNEALLTSEEFGENEFITVGWGKKETQFHGSEGKQAAKVKAVVVADPTTDDSVKITWRGDGEVFAVGFNSGGIRKFKVFDREGKLLCTSENQQGLQFNLCWRPSGNVIATTQKLNGVLLVSFFEKNGLKHGDFKVPIPEDAVVEDLSWSPDSEVLAIQCYNSEQQESGILLYTTSNYHWYRKHTLAYPERIVKIIWDNDFNSEHNKTLHIFFSNGDFFTYTWFWGINHSNGKTDNDDAIVAVINGTRLLVTGFRQTVVPPPMSAYELELDPSINSVAFLQNSAVDSNSFVVLTETQNLIFYRETNKFPLDFEQFSTVQLDMMLPNSVRYQWQWISYDRLICINHSKNNYFLLVYVIDFFENKLTLLHTHKLEGAVMCCVIDPSSENIIIIHYYTGGLSQYTVGGSESTISQTFPACPRLDVVKISDTNHYLGLSDKGNFYINGVLALKNVSSYYIHSYFLQLTTLQHHLLCVELNEKGLEAIKEHSKADSPLVYKRKMERGAKLIISVPHDTRTVFQMPRGNIEVIQPRQLSLKIIGEKLDALKYQEAFDLMRKQRINLNLIYDHDPLKFLENVDHFIDDISNNSWLSLFVSDLENSDVSYTMYSSSYGDRKKPYQMSKQKVTNICNVLRFHIEKRKDKDTKILPLLTSFVKKNTITDLEEALEIVKSLKEQELSDVKLPISSDEAMKYLLYMVDVNRLFDIALGMYDFDLVLLVATKSQKDPKEYITMLNEFNGMDDNYKKFSVNKHLKRFDRAVEFLANCGPERYEELRRFVKYHSLYSHALQLFRNDMDIYKMISDDYGSYLKLKQNFTEAGNVYYRGGSLDKALECFKETLDWEFVIEIAYSYPKEQFKAMCWELANSLGNEKRHKEALFILEHYYKDEEKTITYAIDNLQYKTALRLCTQHNKSDLKENLKASLLEEHKILLELITTNGTTFKRHKERLTIVREVKVESVPEHHDPFAQIDSDLYSDIGSTIASSGTRSSTKTFRSSKNRRKHERKVVSLKEGSRYEELALVIALHTLVTATFDLRSNVKEVNIVLMRLAKDHEAIALQDALDKTLMEMREGFKDIWSNEFLLASTNASIEALNTQNTIIGTIEPHLRIAPVIPDFNWKLNLG